MHFRVGPPPRRKGSAGPNAAPTIALLIRNNGSYNGDSDDSGPQPIFCDAGVKDF
jgi:hypothetical protein